MPKKITVFYAWQSHRPRTLCYNFIKAAAEAALQRLKAEQQVEPGSSVEDAPDIDFELDHSTSGVPGSPQVAETILSKIDACDIFLADLTIVARYKGHDGREHAAPNANVLVRYGYARRSKGLHRIVAVQNSVFGGGNDLPFDLRHLRHPIGYEAKEGDAAKRQKAQEKLTEVLVDAFQSILRIVIQQEKQAAAEAVARDAVTSANRADVIRKKFENDLIAVRSVQADSDTPFLSLTLVPVKPLPEPARLADISYEVAESFLPIHSTVTNLLPDGDRIVIEDKERRNGAIPMPAHYTVVTNEGTVFAVTDVSYEKLRVEPRHDVFTHSEIKVIRDFIDYETAIFEKIVMWLRGLKQIFELSLPVHVGLTLYKVKDIHLSPPSHKYKAFRDSEVRAPRIILVEPIDLHNLHAAVATVARQMKHALDYIWLSAGQMTNDHYDPDGGHIAYRGLR